MKTLIITGYNTTNVNLFSKKKNVSIYSGMIQKSKGKKSYHVTVQVWANGVTKVFTIESLKNVEQKSFELN